mgnify:CR=1 FL=1
MKKKGNFRKVVSGLLAGMTILSTVLSPMDCICSGDPARGKTATL